MTKIHDLIDVKPESDFFFTAIDNAFTAIKSGEIIIAPAENGYLYLVDAFNFDAIKRLHNLINTPLTDLFQVFLPRISTLSGVSSLNLGSTNTSKESSTNSAMNELLKKVWPGPLSLTIKTQPGLSWNLGVKSDLANVRVPNSNFLLKLLERTGPLAVANTKIRNINKADSLKSLATEPVGQIFDFGIVPAFASTIIELVDLKTIRLLREGAISFAQIQAWSSELAITIVP